MTGALAETDVPLLKGISRRTDAAPDQRFPAAAANADAGWADDADLAGADPVAAEAGAVGGAADAAAAHEVAAVAEGFRRAFGREPDGIWSAPGRVSLAGDHTDGQDGLSYAFAIPLRTTVAVATRSDDRVTVATDLAPERGEATLGTLHPAAPISDWRSYPLGIIWAVLEAAGTAGLGSSATGLDVFLSTRLPIGGGLSSSASICAALGLALDDLWRLGFDRQRLAELGVRAEREAAGAASGIADHVTVLLAEPGQDVFYDVRGHDASLIAHPDLAAEGLVALVVDTRESHRNWSATFSDRESAVQRVAEQLGCQTLRETNLDALDAAREQLPDEDYRRARHVITEIHRSLEVARILRTEGIRGIGPTLAASQASLRDDYQVSTERIDTTVELARHLGAVAARQSGTGLGGSVVVLLPQEGREGFVDALAQAYAEFGWPAPRVFAVSADAGAKRER